MTLSNKNIIKTYTIHCTTIKQMSDWLKDNFTKKELDKSKIVFICQDGVSNLELFDKETFQDIVYKEYKYKNCSKKKKFKDKDLQLQGIISWSPEGIEKGYPEFVDNIECPPLPQPGDTLNPTTAANIYTDSAYLNEEVFLEPPNTSMTLKEKGNIMYIFNAGGFKPKPADGEKRIIGNYEYSFNQEWDFTNLKWINMTENQWGVRDLNALGGPLKDSIDGFSIKIPELWK